MKRKHRMGAIGLRIALLHLAAGAWTLTDEGAILGPDGCRLDFPLQGRKTINVDLGDGSRLLLNVSRVMWAHHHGDIPRGYEVDHIDEDRGNDRIDNLQLLTTEENREKSWRSRAPDDAEAIATAKRLRSEGYKSIDIGGIVNRSPTWVSKMTRRSDDRAKGPAVTFKNNWHREQAAKRRATSEMQ
jgi:hypothetical protein